MQKKNKVHLPSYIYPTHYDLTLKPDLEAFVFSGKELIDIVIEKETKKITLHSKNIDIETVKYIQNKKEEFAYKITYDTENETATFYFKNKISKGKAKLSIIFSGILNDNLRGFYKSKYILDKKEKYIATTQFEATDARRAFPCFDEPAHKAIFKVSLIVKEDQEAISNTLSINIEKHDTGYKIINFAPSPKMSTYLLAFIIGEFEYIEGKTKDDVQIRVFTTKGKKHQAKFALETAIKSLEFYNEYFDIPYPLPNLDMIAVPDFESGAMENWGAITYRETALLVDEENTSLTNKQWVAIVIAHEIAHQWFGNLVTMHWWTDLWLNEGFASYMENVCVDHMFPHWHIWNLNLADRYSIALRLDSLSTSHPIEVEVHHPNEISEVFDMVSYAKGSAIIRMLAEYLGEDNFKKGLQYYLKKHSYKNTKTLNLWEAFEEKTNKPIIKIMNSWTKQTGYPLATLTKDKSKYFIKQERFFSSRISRKNFKENTLWQIPIKFNLEQENNLFKNEILLNKKKIFIHGENIGKINTGETSFIRTNYDEETLEKLKKEIIENRMSVRDRLGLIRDMFALAEGGYIKTSKALEFSLAYKNETEFIVWAEIAGGISKIANIINNESVKINFDKYALSLFGQLVKKMGWKNKDGENHSDTFLRNLAISQASNYGDKRIIKEAKELFKRINTSPIKPDLRSVVYNIVTKNGKIKEWRNFEKLYKETEMHEEKERIGKALALFKDKNLLLKTLNFAMSSSVKNQDAPFIIGAVWTNRYGKEITWQFIKKNWKTILKEYGEGGHFLSQLLSPLGNHTTLKDLKDAKKFFSKNPAPGAEKTLEQVYERIESNIAWIKDDKKDIENWLKRNF